MLECNRVPRFSSFLSLFLMIGAFVNGIAAAEEDSVDQKRVTGELRSMLAPHGGGVPSQQLDLKSLPNEPEVLMVRAFVDILNIDARDDVEYKKWLEMAILRYTADKGAAIQELAVNGMLDAIHDITKDGYGAWVLSKFQGSHFDGAAKKKVGDLFASATRYPEVIRLIGVAGVQGAMPKLREIAGTMDLGAVAEGVGFDFALRPEQIKWSAAIALARLGDAMAIGYCCNAIRMRISQAVKYPHMDKSSAYMSLIFELSYMATSEGIGILLEWINNDLPDPLLREAVAKRAAEQLGRLVVDCPPLDIPYQASFDRISAWFKNNPNYSMRR
jgi:hypothetical protein